MGKMVLHDMQGAHQPEQKEMILSQPSALSTENAGMMVRNSSNYGLASSNGTDISLRCDTVSNVVGEVCGVIKSLITAIAAVKIEKEKTEQVKQAAKAQIKTAKEQTKQVRFQQIGETERFKMECITELRKAEMEMKKELAEIEKEKEKLFCNERMFNKIVEGIISVINSLIARNQELSQNDFFSDETAENNKALIQCLEQLTGLWINEKSK